MSRGDVTSAGPASQVRQRAAVDPVGEETLELFAEHPAYNRLLWARLQALAPVEGRVLEVGCGIGTITELILACPRVEAVHGIDLDPAYVDRVRNRLPDDRLTADACSMEDFLPDRFAAAAAGAYDRIVCSNVLEHIEDDVAAMRNFARLLAPGGVVLLLVPAHRWLYSSLDRALSHHRRYRPEDLRRLAEAAGLHLERLRHFNPLGVLGWLVNGKVLRRDVLPAGQLRAYGRFAVPVSAVLDRLNPFPLGVSVLGAFRKRR